MEKLNLCEILKGHEDETFYSRCFGKLILIDHVDLKFETSAEFNNQVIKYYTNGNFSELGEQDLFPSKDQRDWNKWVEEQKPKVPKTWSELIKEQEVHLQSVATSDLMLDYSGDTSIEKSAIALLKIHQLIKVGYGGNITDKEWNRCCYPKYFIEYNNETKIFRIMEMSYSKSHIAFHTNAQAEEFLKYPENRQLLKDYFMI